MPLFSNFLLFMCYNRLCVDMFFLCVIKMTLCVIIVYPEILQIICLIMNITIMLLMLNASFIIWLAKVGQNLVAKFISKQFILQKFIGVLFWCHYVFYIIVFGVIMVLVLKFFSKKVNTTSFREFYELLKS
jgi:hypothetical protein